MNRESTIRLLNSFLETELNSIKEAYAASNLESDHLDAGLSIAWSCYMFKDWVNQEIKNKLTEFATDLAYSDDNDWVWLASVLSAAHLLKENEEVRDRLLNQVSHGSSAHREGIIKGVMFMVPTISFSNDYLQQAVLTNIERSQGFYQESTVLYLCTQGKDDDKRRWALKAKKRFNEYDDHQAFFEELFQKSEFYQNPFFSDVFSAAKSYFIFKVLASPSLSDYQSNLNKTEQSKGALVQELQDREDAHPLSHSYIDLRCLKENKTGLFGRE